MRASVLMVAGAALLGLAVAVLVGPAPPSLGRQVSGDQPLGARVNALVEGADAGWDALAVAELDGGVVRHAGFGQTDDGAVDERTAFEIGSVTKVLTGMLLADLESTRQVALDDRVGDLAPPLAGHETGDATLGQLASHRSGYPRLPLTPDTVVALAASRLTRGDPYTADAGEILTAAAGAATDDAGAFAYSNLGMATLGHALAVDRGASYATLLRRRILGPLDMTDTTLPDDLAELPAPRASGRSASGLPGEPWLATGWAPSGVGVWSTGADLTRLLRGVLDGDAPGVGAVAPRWETDDAGRVGLGWFTDPVSGRDVAWHNGGTGGFSSWVGIDLEAQRGVVVLGNTTRRVDGLGERLLVGSGADPVEAPTAGWSDWLIGALLVGMPLQLAWTADRARRHGHGDRLRLLRVVGEAVIALALARLFVTWQAVPPVLWTLAFAVASAGTALAALGWARLPTTRSARPRWAAAGTAAHVALVVALLALTV